MQTSERVFQYRLDFYYQQAIFYLVTLIVYVGIRGSFVEDNFTFVLRDPILYVIAIFVMMSFGVLLLNRIRDRKLIITEQRLIFHHRFHQREVPFGEIEWMHIGRERHVQTAGRFQVIVLKLKGRRRLLRIRVGRYEREKELVGEMQRIGDRVPKGKKRRFGLRQELEA